MKRSAHVIVLIAFGLAAAFAVLGTLFVAGEILTDPGGWSGVGLVALWLVPMLVLSAGAWWWPSVTTWVLGGLVVLIAADWVWSAVDPSGWSDLFRSSPSLGLLMFVAILPMAVLGLHRPAVAGAMLVATALVSYAAFLSTIWGDTLAIGSSLTTSRTVTIVPMLVIGALYLLAAALGHSGGRTAPIPPPADTPVAEAPTSADKAASSR